MFVRKMVPLIVKVSGFYATTPLLDLNFALQFYNGFNMKNGNRNLDQDGLTGSMTNYSHSHMKNIDKPFNCPKCGRCFTVKGNMTRHYRFECDQPPRFQCPHCNFRSKQTSNVLSHIRTRHPGQKIYYDTVHLKEQQRDEAVQNISATSCGNDNILDSKSVELLKETKKLAQTKRTNVHDCQ